MKKNKTIPQNGKYTSHNIQNEIIDTLAKMVLNEIKERNTAKQIILVIVLKVTAFTCRA